MAFQIRTKRVAAALHGGTSAARKVAGYDSSGSDHGATMCLSGLVQAFLETADSDEEAAASRGGGPEHEGSGEDEEADVGILKTVRELMFPPPEKDLFRAGLAADVYEAAESLSWLKNTAPALRRATMMRLRAAGYNAGICKAKWDAAGGILAGCYEYIDVVTPAGDETREMRKGRRYIVDLDFAAEFEVARATESYRSVVAALPPVAVAADEALRRVVREVSDAARRSLRARGLHVPPWRKTRYMLAKWLGPYRRITNPVTSSASLADAVARGDGEVKCRAVGFPTATPLAVLSARTR